MKRPNAVTTEPPMPAAASAEALELPVVPLAPFIVSDPGICSGDPTIAGTRIGVHDVVAMAGRYDGNLERVRLEELPHLSAEQIDAAMAWYHHHKEEIEKILRRRQASYERLLAQTRAAR